MYGQVHDCKLVGSFAELHVPNNFHALSIESVAWWHVQYMHYHEPFEPFLSKRSLSCYFKVMAPKRLRIWPGVSSGEICSIVRAYVHAEKMTDLSIGFKDSSCMGNANTRKMSILFVEFVKLGCGVEALISPGIKTWLQVHMT